MGFCWKRGDVARKLILRKASWPSAGFSYQMDRLKQGHDLSNETSILELL